MASSTGLSPRLIVDRGAALGLAPVRTPRSARTVFPGTGLPVGLSANAAPLRDTTVLCVLVLHCGLAPPPMGLPPTRTGLPGTGLGTSPLDIAILAHGILLLLLPLVFLLFLARFSGLPTRKNDDALLLAELELLHQPVCVPVVTLVNYSLPYPVNAPAQYSKNTWRSRSCQGDLHLELHNHVARYCLEVLALSYEDEVKAIRRGLSPTPERCNLCGIPGAVHGVLELPTQLLLMWIFCQ